MLLMIDNYDSFTFNLVQYFGELGEEVRVIRNDAVDLAGVRALDPSAIVISPGPGTPDDAGISLEVLAALSGVMPIFGVCLGHQAIGQAFGGKVVRARSIMHGKTSPIHHDGRGVFAGLPNPFEPRVTTRWWWSRLRCRSVWRFRPGPRMRTAAATRSWACAIAASRSKACSSIRNPSSPSTAMPCCAISWTMACRAQPESALSKLWKTHADHSAAGAAALH